MVGGGAEAGRGGSGYCGISYSLVAFFKVGLLGCASPLDATAATLFSDANSRNKNPARETTSEFHPMLSIESRCLGITIWSEIQEPPDR